MKKREKGLSCGENALPYTQEHEGGDPINGETSLREMAGELPAVEDGWREVGFLLVDLSLNIVMTEGDIKEKSEAGEKCYRLLHGRRAPCRKCAAAETFRDGAPRSVICERGRGRTKVRCRADAYPVRDAAGLLWGVIERIFEETPRPENTKQRKATTENVSDGIDPQG